jgi:hypothetical protein
VEYQNVYPGINLLHYGNQRQLEYDFQLDPGANPGAIQLAFQGAQGLSLDAQGNLRLHTAGGDVVEHAPLLYQMKNGVRQALAGQYILTGPSQVGFRVGAYDTTLPLVIDPVLVYSTYLGGGIDDYGQGIAVDSSGNAYVTGFTNSLNFPTASPFQASQGGGPLFFDAFMAKLNSTGTATLYSTYLGGLGDDGAYAIALDNAGNPYITGVTTSNNFPATALFGTPGRTVFVTKFNPTGSALVYSSPCLTQTP